jgi:hypothetical protein
MKITNQPFFISPASSYPNHIKSLPTRSKNHPSNQSFECLFPSSLPFTHHLPDPFPTIKHHRIKPWSEPERLLSTVWSSFSTCSRDFLLDLLYFLLLFSIELRLLFLFVSFPKPEPSTGLLLESD